MEVTQQVIEVGAVRVPVRFYQSAPIPDLNVVQTRPLAIILPGGGYAFYSQRESEIIALNYLAQGFAAAVVDYRLSDQPPVLPTALYQVGAVVSYYHQHAAEKHLAADKIVLAGFSAGGHLAALYADLWNSPAMVEQLGVAATTLRLGALALAYPVIGLRLGWPASQADLASVAAIAGKYPYHEADQLVTTCNPATFIWATATDELVPVTNTLAYTQALVQAGISVQCKVYAQGPHGLSLARADTAEASLGPNYAHPEVASWFGEEMDWLNRLWELDDFWLKQ